MASITGVGAGDFTDKTSKKKGASQSSSNDGSLFCPSLSSTCNCRQHTGNEVNNIFNFSSIYDSFLWKYKKLGYESLLRNWIAFKH